jgi:hypothetical protein
LFHKKLAIEERRKYRRIDTIFPVEFQLLEDDSSLVSWHQCFSQDISKGGICVIINNISLEESLRVIRKGADTLLQIHSPISDRCFLAYAKIAWSRKIRELPFSQYIVGLEFTKIDTQEIDRFINYINSKKTLWHTLQLLIIGLLFFLAFIVTHNLRLHSSNLALLNRYSQLLNQDLLLGQSYKSLLEERDSLKKGISNSGIEMEILKESIKKMEAGRDKEIVLLEEELSEAKKNIIESEEDAVHVKDLKTRLEELKRIKDEETKGLKEEVALLQKQERNLNTKISKLIAMESEIKGKLPSVEQEQGILVEAFTKQLYKWLKNHQNHRTGLVVSFEGDFNLKDISYVYDQALSIMAHTISGDYGRAEKCLDFFLDEIRLSEEGAFYNAYYSSNGDVVEYVSHAGPNLWLGMAALQYSQKTKNNKYLVIAEKVAKWIKFIQDEEGGIIGGTSITWYSTEHNLDAFAFFNMFYEYTKDEKYKTTTSEILNWLRRYAYGNELVPVNRGKGDSTIATDTYAWSIAALGPVLLKSIEMDPDKIMDFAAENCLVKTEFNDRYGKIVKVEGFDFAKQKHLPRGGVVSCEWTAQMVLSFYMLSDYYYDKGEVSKATGYRNKAIKFINELNKMVVSSPSAFGQGEWCLPYASQDNVDTGHGWYTPQGSRTGSVAATAYTIFAISKFNPLKFQDK